MSARSSTRDLVLACAIAACGSKPPEADPEAIAQLARVMIRNTPAPAGLRSCAPSELVGVPMTHLTLARLAHQPLADYPYNAEWANPPELDAPAARAIADAHADATASRRAAAELLAAQSYIVYRLDYLDAPIALGMKSPKRGALGGRAIRYDRDGRPSCLIVFGIRNDEARSDWAIAHSDRALIDPAVAQAMRDDLAAQYVLHAPRASDAGSAK
jgi:hypothetical protein